MSHSRLVLLRDLAIFQVKLLLDGLKDIVLMPATLAAATVDILLPGPRPGHRFYAVMTVGERFDRWLNLFSASHTADASKDGLFGRGRAGRSSMVSGIEDLLARHSEPRVERDPRHTR